MGYIFIYVIKIKLHPLFFCLKHHILIILAPNSKIYLHEKN